jgi:hypothetical protein
MFRRGAISVFLSAILLFLPPHLVSVAQSPPLVAAASTISYFQTEALAQVHCRQDVVVRLNIRSGIYHYKGERWYVGTRHGAYVCERVAITVGDRASKNGR